MEVSTLPYTATILPPQDTAKSGVKVDLVLVNVFIQLFTAQHFGNLHQLVIVVMTMEEWLFAKYLYGKKPNYNRVELSYSAIMNCVSVAIKVYGVV